jgi:hypothetical protein
MRDLAQQRCFNHDVREAVARCPECKRHFCRECITEHEDRVLCSMCLKKFSKGSLARRGTIAGLMRLAQGLLGILIAWLFFFVVGETLSRLPDAFHDAELWSTGWMDPP